jgi:hypothetical protein
MDGMISTGETSDSFTRALWKSSSRKAGGTGEGSHEFDLRKYLCPYFA